MSLALLAEELRERFLRLTLGALGLTALLVNGFSLAGSVASAVFRNFRAAVVAIGLGAIGSTGTALGGRPRGRLGAGASLEVPAAFSSAAAWRCARSTFGGSSLPSSCFFGMAASCRGSRCTVSPRSRRACCPLRSRRLRSGTQERASVEERRGGG